MPPKMEALGTQNLKKSRKQTTQKKNQKNNTQKVGFRMQNDLILEVLFRARRLLFRIRKHENPQNPQNWSPDFQNRRKMSILTSKNRRKIMISAFQNLDNSHANCLLFAFFFSASLANVSSKKRALHRLHLEDFWLICSICMWIIWKLYPRCARLYLFRQLFKKFWPAAAVLAQPTGITFLSHI